MSDQESAKTTLFEGLFKNVVLRPFLRMVGSLFGQSSNQSSGEIDSMAYVTISSSSSDDSILREIENYRESPQRDTATSSASPFPQPSTGYGGQSGTLGAFQSRNAEDNNLMYHGNNANSGFTIQGSSNKRPLASNGGSSNVMSGPAGTLHLQTAQANSSDNYNKDDNVGHQSFKRAKRTSPGSFQTSMPSSERPTYVDMSSSRSNVNKNCGRGGSIEVVDIGTSSNKGTRVLPNSLAAGRSAPHTNVSGSSTVFPASTYINASKQSRVLPTSIASGRSSPYTSVSGPSRALPASITHGRSANSNANMSGPSYQVGDGEEETRGTDERTLFQAALKDLSGTTGETDVPDGVLSVSLLAHQRVALAWMMLKERGGGACVGGILADDQGLGKTISMIALIQMQRSTQDNYKSEEVSTIKPEAFNLDDDDDDITVASTPADLKPKVELGVKKETPGASSSKEKLSHMKPLGGTLVVCPASVLRQWVRELDEKVTDESKLSVLMYHGSHRTKDPVELAKHDVVLTTYSIVSVEVPKQPLVDDEVNDQFEDKFGLSSEFSFNKKLKKTSGNKKGRKGKNGTYSDASDGGALAKVRWFRIILDEAQTIKNHRTQVARACCSLRAKRRWCLSGTPIQNAIDELFSYFRFLRHDPLSNYKTFIHLIKAAISKDSQIGYKKLQLVLKAIMLRRTKGTMLNGKPIITLPPKNIRLTRVEFSAEERAFYSKLEADSKTQFKAYAAAGTVNQNYANILLLLLRLRQACDHPLLVKGFNSDVAGREPSKVAKNLPTKKLQSLIRQLETSLAICGVCQDPPENAVVTICGHVFCFQCVSDYLTGEDTTCPEPGCKEQVSADVVFTKRTLKNCLSDELVNDPSSSSGRDEPSKALDNCSSKIKSTIQILETYCKPSVPGSDLDELAIWDGDSSAGYGCSGSSNYKPTKAIVFSQWTGMLDLVENALGGTDIVHRRLDGTMSLAARDKAVKDFNTRPEVTVMLMSLKAGNLGLNMVAACHVILLDLWWNPTTEDQAIDRAHRIGQTRTVTVTRLTVKDTVEDRILALQEEKRKMVASAFGEDPSGGSAGRLTMEDLWDLFGVRRSDFH